MTLLARINARLDEIEAGPAVIAVTVFLLTSIAALIFGGQTVLNVVLIAAGALLIWNAGIGHSRNDEALDGVDQNSRQIEDVKTVLFGNETGNGKHSKGKKP